MSARFALPRLATTLAALPILALGTILPVGSGTLLVAPQPDRGTAAPTTVASPVAGDIATVAVPTGGADRPSGLPAGSRMPRCATEGYRFRVLYVTAKSATDRSGVMNDQIRTSLKRANAFLHAEATSGANSPTSRMDLNVVCNGAGDIAITTHRSNVAKTTDPSQIYTKITADLQSAGFTDPEVIYLAYWDEPVAGKCGEAQRLHNSSQTTTPNGGGFALNYDCLEGSTTSYDSLTWLHELSHAVGAVSDNAPNSNGQGHCNDGLDVMCYPQAGNYRGDVCGTVRMDCGRNDYFDLTPGLNSYLDKNWNLASCANDFFFRTGCVSATRNVRLTGGVTTITVKWDPPSDNGGRALRSYRVLQASCATCAYQTLATVPASQREYTSGALPTTTYYYQVRALNEWSDLGPSPTVSGTAINLP